MKKNNGLALVGLVLTFVSTDLNAGVTSRVRDFFFGPPRETSTAHPVTRNAQVEQYRRQLQQDAEERGASALRQPAQTHHVTQEYPAPSPAPTYAPQPLSPSQKAAQRGPAPLPPSPLSPSQKAAQRGPAPLPPSPLSPSQKAAQRGPAPLPPSPHTPTHTTPQASQFHSTSKHPGSPSAYDVPAETVGKINQRTPSYSPGPQESQPQPKQSIFSRVTHKVTGILKPKKEEVAISGPTGYRSNRDTILNQTEFRELKAADETAARARAIPPKPTYSPPPRPQQPAAFSNAIPSQPRLSQKFPQTQPPTPPQRPTRYINVPATRTDGQSADASPLPLR